MYIRLQYRQLIADFKNKKPFMLIKFNKNLSILAFNPKNL
jgi:hypothetical protein